MTHTTDQYYSGSRSFRFSSFSSGSPYDQYLITPELVVTEGDQTVSFWYRKYSYGSEVFRVGWSSTGTATADFTWTDDITNSSTTWQQYSKTDLPIGTKYVAIHYYSNYAYYLYVDDFVGPEIYIPPTPPSPANIVSPADEALNVALDASLNWSSGGGFPDGYYLSFGTVDPYTTILDGEDMEGDTSYEPQNLAYGTEYWWQVVPYNTYGNAPGCPIWEFTTIDDPSISTFPWTVDFGSTSADAFPPLNWNRMGGQYPNANGTSSYWIRDEWLNGPTGNNAAKMNVYGTGRYSWLVTPPIAIPAGDYELKFDLGLTDYGNSNPIEDPAGQLDDRFIVAISDSPTMENPTILREWNNSGSEYVFNAISHLGETQIIDLSAYTGTYYVAFYAESTVSGGDNDLFVDNVTVRETPALPIFSYAPDTIDFGTVTNGAQVGPQNVTITNLGGGTLNITTTDISITGTDATEFSFDDSALPAALGVGQSVQIPVYVTGVTEGTISATLSIMNNSTQYDVALSADVLPAGIIAIGSGTANNNLPVNPFYGYTYSQSIFLQNEIGIADQRIEKISYYWNGAGATANTNDWVIYMGHTSADAFASNTDWLPLANLTQVYSGVVAAPAVAGWVEIVLDTPFVYNNTDNLVVAVDENTPSYDSSGWYYYSTPTATSRSLRYYSDSTNPDPAAPITGSLVSAYPNIMMQFGEIPMVPPGTPTLVYPADGETGLPKAGFDLSWTPDIAAGMPDYYGVYIASSPETIYDEEYFETSVAHFNPVEDGGMTFNYGDRWYWTVEAFNIYGSALQETPFSFRIEQDPTVYVGPDTPWTEGFEGATFPPFGWTMNDADSDGQNWFSYNADGSAHTGLKSAASASWTSTTYALNPDNWLITPPVAIPATGEYLMEYYVGAQDPDFPQDHYGLYISTTGTAPADFSLLFEETLMDGAWYYRSQNLASYAGQTVHFAFRHFDSYDWFYMKIDDVTVRELPETPTLAISPTEWDFGSVQLLNPTTPKSFSLSNVGAGTIDILAGDIQLTGDVEGNFVLVANNLPVPLSGSNTYTFTVQFIPQSLGPKTATVTIEDNITREIHTITLSGEGIEEPIASVIALQGAVETQVNVRLNWASIYGDPTQAGYVHWDDSIQRGNVGAGATPFHAVAKYGTEVTALAAGKVLDGVMIHIAEEPQLITSVKVWTGTDADLAPLTMVHEETVSDLTVGWNYVALTTPVPITGTDAIYVGYYSTGMLDVFPASTDGLTAVDGRGNVVEISGSWNTLTASSITGSWLIHAHFAEAAPIMAGRRPVVLQNVAVNNVEMTDEALRNSPVKARMNGNVDRVLRGFNVYRDGVQINSEIVAAYTYLDEGLAADTYHYAAQAVHYSANGPISGTIPVTVDPPADPIALPFLEDWASSGYDTNMWSIGSSNWGMNTTTGNPAPSASFSWSPRVYDYNSILASYEFDATGIASVQFSFDLYLNNYSTDAENTMTWEVWDGSAWNTLGSYSSLDDNLGWTTYAYDISAYAANRVFKIRFVAAGEDSYEINYWYLDNIYLAFLPSTMDPITDLSISTDGLTIDLNWTAVPNATWYMIYASEDPYATFLPLGFVPTAGASLPTSALPTDKAFVKVTAGTGPFPAGRNLSE